MFWKKPATPPAFLKKTSLILNAIFFLIGMRWFIVTFIDPLGHFQWPLLTAIFIPVLNTLMLKTSSGEFKNSRSKALYNVGGFLTIGLNSLIVIFAFFITVAFFGDIIEGQKRNVLSSLPFFIALLASSSFIEAIVSRRVFIGLAICLTLAYSLFYWAVSTSGR